MADTGAGPALPSLWPQAWGNFEALTWGREGLLTLIGLVQQFLGTHPPVTWEQCPFLIPGLALIPGPLTSGPSFAHTVHGIFTEGQTVHLSASAPSSSRCPSFTQSAP